jgi:hypothetical protein
MKTHPFKIAIFLLFLAVFFISSIHHVLAQCEPGCLKCEWESAIHRYVCLEWEKGKPLGQIGGEPEEGFGPWGNLGKFLDPSKAAGALTGIISRTIGVMTIVAGIWFIFQFIIGAYGFMTAGGDQQKMGNATKKITSALIGLVVIVAAYAVFSLLSELLGFPFLNLEPLIKKLGPGLK